MPIVMSQKEWARINQWANMPAEDPDVTRRREYVQYLTATSNNMTKSWPNSLENMNKRNEELRQARIATAEQANTKFYKKYLKTQKANQEHLMYSARDIVFKNKDAPKLLLSAVIETVTQKERLEQLKFNEQLRREAMEQKRKEDDDIIRRAKEWHELNALKKKRRFDVNKVHQKEILEQAKEISERKRKEYEMELNQQKIDNIEAEKEIAALKRFDGYYQKWEKERILRDMQDSKEAYDNRKREQLEKDKMDDKLIELLNKSRARVEARRKQTEKEMKDEKLRVLEAISKRLVSGDAEREAKDQAILDKAVAEKNAVLEARFQADERKKKMFRQQRHEIQQKFLKDEAQRIHEFNTIRQWEIMNRFKNAELYDEFKEKLRKEKERKIQEYREDILKLWKEREDREARELAESRYFYGELAEKKIRDGDNKVLTHAARLLEECHQHGRPDFALKRTIDQYCKMHRLYPMPPLPASMAEHFKGYAPWDGSKPDPDYTEPPPPKPPTPPQSLQASSSRQMESPKSPETKEMAKPAEDVKPPETAKSAESATKPETAKPSETGKQPETAKPPAAVKPAEIIKPPEARRDGLQKSPKAGPSKQPSKPPQAKPTGRANGLQVRNLQTTIDQPDAAAMKCRNPSCTCGLEINTKG